MGKRIIVINPNSTQEVTNAMDKAFDSMRVTGAPVIQSITNRKGPSGIECQQDADQVAMQIVDIIQEYNSCADAFVIACFSDPGIFSAREITDRPVFGIAESGILSALSLGDRYGIIAILDRSIPRHIRYIRSMGLETRFAGDIAIGIGVTGLNQEVETFSRLEMVGRKLIDVNGANTLILGCAGMARYRVRLQDRLGVTVVDPAQAAVSMAIGAVQLGHKNKVS
jgi:allantoin racemase